MDLRGFAKYIRRSGCRLRLYEGLASVKECLGYFDVNTKGPYICAAMKGMRPKDRMELLAHEYCHYLQWYEEKDLDVEEVEMFEIHENWLAHKNEYTPEILKEAREFMLHHEWDADRRASELCRKLNLEPWDEPTFLRGTQSYVNSLKWSWECRLPFITSISRWRFKPLVMTEEEAIAPLTIEQFKKIDKWMRGENHL